MQPRLDHLVYAVSDLDDGVREIESRLAVCPLAGGEHPGRGTRNALIGLGNSSYLEIVAPAPRQPPPARSRWLGADAITNPRLSAWAVTVSDLPSVRQGAIARGVPLGEIVPGSRRSADGTLLSWRLTDPDPLTADGVVPFLIDWGDSPHPSQSARAGATLLNLRIEHPEAVRVRRMLEVLEIDVTVIAGAAPAIIALIDGPRGRIELR